MISVAFLFDKSNDWLAKYFADDFGDSKKYKFFKSYNKQEVKGFNIVFVLGYTELLGKDVIEANDLLLVIHESDLPKGRGFAPIQWQVLEGAKDIPVCLLELSDGADKGDICDKILLSLDGTELYDEIREKQAKVTIELIKRFLNKYPEVNFQKQHGQPTFYRRRNSFDPELDVNKTIKSQFNLLRVCNNKDWPAFFELEGVMYTLRIEKVE